MNKIIIRDISAFCTHAEKLKGTLFITSSDLEEITGHDVRISLQDIELNFSFQGKKNFEGELFLEGSWESSVRLKCSMCLQDFEHHMEKSYFPLRVLGEDCDSLSYEEDALECSFRQVDLAQWLFSELMLELPVNPRHKVCDLQPETLSHLQTLV